MKLMPLKKDDEMSLFDNFYGMFDNFWTKTKNGLMKTDITEDEKNYYLVIDLPGFAKTDLKLNLEDGYLSISVNTQREINEQTNFIRRERFYGTYERSFYVGDIDEKDINASYDNGVLTISINKNTKVTADSKKTIPVQ